MDIWIKVQTCELNVSEIQYSNIDLYHSTCPDKKLTINSSTNRPKALNCYKIYTTTSYKTLRRRRHYIVINTAIFVNSSSPYTFRSDSPSSPSKCSFGALQCNLFRGKFAGVFCRSFKVIKRLYTGYCCDF